MPRVRSITTRADLAPEHHAIYDAIVASRGNLRGVFTVLLHSPELALRVSELGHYVRYQTALDPKVAELAVLVVAREQDQPSIWSAHVNYAREAGVREAAIVSIKYRTAPADLTDEEALIVGCVQRLLRQHRLEDDAFQSLLDKFGLQGLVDFTATVGYFAMMACVQNAFGFEAWPDGDKLPTLTSGA